MRFNTDNVNTKDKHSIELENFLGVDFSSSPINVSKKRASFAKNLINKDGVNQKRPGWKELITIKNEFLLSNTSKITNLFVNKLEISGQQIEIILAITEDGKVYRIYYDKYNNVYDYEIINKYNVNQFTYYYNISKENQVFVKDNFIYILGGEYLIYRNIDTEFYKSNKTYNFGDLVQYNGFVYTCRKSSLGNIPTGFKTNNDYWTYLGNAFICERIDGYIPTTTKGIKSIESGDTSVTPDENINLLRAERYNTLLGVSSGYHDVYYDTADRYAENGKTYYELDEDGDYVIASVSVHDFLGDTHNRSNGYFEKHSCISYLLDNGSILTDSNMEIKVETLDGSLNTITTEIKSGHPEATYGSSQSDRFLIDNDRNLFGFIDYNSGIIYFNNDITLTPPIADEDNIEVLYTPYEDYGSIIRNCSFGTQFGINGLSDTLFISGNKDYKNQDFYSDSINGDWTYFPAGNIDILGSKYCAIKAHLRINDGTLAIFKESSNTEPTIYYRGVIQNSDGKIEFPITNGAIGEGVINNRANGNLAGDNLFLSENGVFGLTLANNVVTNERYAKERDRFIHSSLIKHDLTNAVATIYQGRYYLSVDNVVYIFDSRYKSTENKDADDTFNYECWYWENNIEITCFYVYKDKLYFGTSDGKICLFTNNSYSDDTRISLGNISVNIEDNTITINSSLSEKINDNQEIIFGTQNDNSIGTIYGVVYSNNLIFTKAEITNITKSGNRNVIFTIPSSDDLQLFNNQIIVAEISNSKYLIQVTECNKLHNQYTINAQIREYGIDSDLFITLFNNASSCEFFETINYKNLYITEFDGIDTFKVKDSVMGDEIDIRGVRYSGQGFYADVIDKQPIETIWFSPALDLGLYDYSKNLDSISVVLDPNLKGQITFGYETKKVSLDLIAKQIEEARTSISNHSFSFDDIDFNDFTFETAFTSSYTKRVRERNVNFIMIKAYSNDDKNSALQSLKAVYTLYKKNRGVR